MLDSLNPRLRRAIGVATPPAAILAVQLALFPLPLGMWVQGLTLGLLGALVAVGMALVYRANRILNFAQGDLGMAPATLSVLLIHSFAWHYIAGLAAGLLAAVILGALSELLIVRRFFRAPRLVLTVATIGLAQLLVVITLFLPRWLDWLSGRSVGDPGASAERIPAPVDLTFRIEPLLFTANHVVAWTVGVVALVAVGLFLRFTSVGVAIRASADRADRASLLGVPVKRLHTYVWTIAGVLSFTGLFLRAGVLGLPFGTAFGLQVLLLAFAALTLGRMTDLPTIAASALALGLLEQGVRWNDSVSFGLFELDARAAVLVSPIVGLFIIGALLFQKVGASRAEQDPSSSWQSAEDVRPVPPELRSVPEVRLVRLGIGVLVVGALLVLPHLLGTRDSLLASAVVIYAMITLSIVVLTGWAGQVSLGQMAFVAVGGAVGGVATTSWDLDIALGLLIAGVAGALVAVLVGLPALRLRGLYLGVVTLAFALAATSYFLNPRFFGWVPQGRVERPDLLGQWSLDSATSVYYFSLAALLLMAFLVQGVRRSRTGRVLIAMRENERGAQAYGVSVVRAKLTAFALSGFVAAFAGGMFVHHQQSFGDTFLSPEQNLLVFTAAVVGGLGSMLGAVLGAVYLQGGAWFLPTELQLLATSVGVLIVLLMMPGGIGGVIYRGRDLWLRSVARRKGIVSPSLLADTRAVEQAVEEAFEERADAIGQADATEDDGATLAGTVGDPAAAAPTAPPHPAVGSSAPGEAVQGSGAAGERR